MATESLTYALVVGGPAYGTQDASSAYRFARALVTSEHRLEKVFFYQAGVYNGNLLQAPASDETQLYRLWCELAEQHQVKLELCISAAQRRGLIDQANGEGELYNVKPPFEVTGLGQLAESLLTVDRVVQF